jgi:hypothetical protein
VNATPAEIARAYFDALATPDLDAAVADPVTGDVLAQLRAAADAPTP